MAVNGMIGRLAVGILVFSVIAGCGKSGDLKTVNVAGTVYIDGKPVDGVKVNFLTEKHAGSGKTLGDGTYVLVQGAEPGENKIYFSKVVNSQISNDPESGMDMGQFEAMAMAAGDETGAVMMPGQVIPRRYCDPTKSDITFNVPEAGTESADFRLSSKQ